MAPCQRLRLGILLGTGLIVSILFSGSAMLLERSRQTALNAAGASVQNAALVVENTINRQLLQVDGALAGLPALFAAVADQTGELDQQSATRLLQSFNFGTFAFRDLLLVRPDGTIWSAARPRLGSQSHSRLSSLQRMARPGAVAIDGPVRNRLTGGWSWFLARPITLPGIGELQAVAEIPVAFITTILAPVGEIPGLRIDIVRADGALLASLPHDEGRIGKPAAPGRSDAKAAKRAGIIAISRPTLYPDVKVALTLDLSTAMADWVRDRNRAVAAVAATGLLVLALAAALFAAMRQREWVELERMRSRQTLDDAIESMADGFVMWDEQDRLITCNQRFRDMYAISAPFMQPGALFEDVMTRGLALGQYPQAGDNREQFVRDIVDWHQGNHGAIERLLPDGRWVLVTERHTLSGGTVGIRTDITALKVALTDLTAANIRATQAIADVQIQNAALSERDVALRTQNMLFDAALNNMSQGLLMVDSDRRLIVCNKRFLEIFEIAPEAASAGMTTAALFHAVETAGGLTPAAVRNIYRYQEDLAGSDRSGKFVTVDDDHLALSIAQCPLADGGWVATYEDVTEQQSNERHIRFMAHHDALTGLPNRALFRNKIDEALGHLAKSGDGLALLYLDLDKFKYVNDTLGHPVGDELLKIAGRRLRACVRETDVVARFGGDEFAVLCVTRDLPEEAVALAQRIIEALSAPYHLGQRQVTVGASVGIAFAAGNSKDCDTLLKNADMALYRAKAQGRGAYCIFEVELEARLHARLTSEAELRTAVELGQFEVYYQPILDLHSEEICGYEALLRWQHPARGIVSPEQFIPLAEELGLIKSIGTWVFQRACADAVQFLGGAKVAVNLSPIQLEDDSIVEVVRSALSASGLAPARLEIEITESALLTNSAVTIELLVRLHSLGVSIALDDFGTGYSSLSYLRSFPFDKIKIDRLFISEMATREDCAAIVTSVVALAAKLGMTTTAEGVETTEQLNLVRDVGCSSVQGYLLSRPLPITKVARYRDRLAERIRDLNDEYVGTEAALP